MKYYIITFSQSFTDVRFKQSWKLNFIIIIFKYTLSADVAFHQNLSQILWPTEKSTWYMDFPIETTIHDKSITSA